MIALFFLLFLAFSIVALIVGKAFENRDERFEGNTWFFDQFGGNTWFFDQFGGN